MLDRVRSHFRGGTLGKDAVAGLVLGGKSVPDGLATGLLAGVNPIFGLYSYLFGMLGGAFVTSSIYMTVQSTGATAAVIADVSEVREGADADRTLFTLAILTGVVMIVAGLLKLGSILRFVSNAVMVGFITGVGVNIVLGQLDDFTGYDSSGSNRAARAFDLLLHPLDIDLATLATGVLTVAMIVLLQRTRVGTLSLVVAVVVASAIVAVLGWDVAQLRDVVEIPTGLPAPELPLLGAIPSMIIPALSVAFVALIQGAGISASFPNPDGTYPNPSRDFVGQGVGNLVSGTFRGLPVGGSMSATSVMREAGGRTNLAKLIAGAVMAAIMLVLGGLVELVAMPALAGLLIVVGVRTINPHDIVAVAKTGRIQATTMTVTFVLTILLPLQYAVLVGVGISALLYVVRESNDLVVKRRLVEPDGLREVEAPATVGRGEVIVLQPYGSLFFASAKVFEGKLPDVTRETKDSVVIIRMRGRTDLGSTLTDVLGRYAAELRMADSKLMLISDSDRILRQLAAKGVIAEIGTENLYESDEWIGRTVRRAHDDAERWIAARQP